jgi:hypothetical protein
MIATQKHDRPHWAHIGTNGAKRAELRECLESGGAPFESVTKNTFFVYYDDDENARLAVLFRLRGLLEHIDLINWSGNEESERS